MPIYEYVCKNCGKKTENIQGYADKPLVVCPHCGKRALKKAISAPAIQFKGSGWYVTDYARSQESKDAGRGARRPTKARSRRRADKADKSESTKADKTASDEKAGKSEKVDKRQVRQARQVRQEKVEGLTVAPQRISVC